MNKDKNSKDFDTAEEDTFKLLEKWEKENITIYEAYFASISVLVGALFHMAPTKKAAEDLLKVSIDMGKDRNIS